MTKVVLTSVVILFAYLFELARLHPHITFTKLSDIAEYLNVANAVIIAGFLIGASIPFLFSALTIRAVSKVAFNMIEEVRRQFREIPGLLERNAKKLVEAGHFGGRGKPVCAVAVIGDTVGDPLKDTAVPKHKAVRKLLTVLFSHISAIN